MPELTWKEAIVKVLEEAEEPLHYTDITQRIFDHGLKSKGGTTPWSTVASVMITSINQDGSGSPFERTQPGFYKLRGRTSPTPDSDADGRTVSAFGVHWRRKDVLWAANPSLYGRQGPKGNRIDLGKQRGIYILYDAALGLAYVGQALKQSMARRLYQHTSDRLAARWQYFSWFGVRPVLEDGSLGDLEGSASPASLIDALEGILIEAVEPRLNRQGGQGLDGCEYIQARDPRL